MALYAFASVMVCWVGWGYRMSFGEKMLPFWGYPAVSLDADFLLQKAFLGNFPTATMVFFQGVFACITLILVAGCLLGRMNFTAWVMFVPLWLTFSYTVGAFSVWCPEGWLAKLGIIDFSGGTVPWYTMMVLHKRLRFLTHADDPMAIFHTHAIAGSLGGILTGIFAVPKLCRLFFMVPEWERYIGLAYALQNNRSMAGFRQLGIQLVGIGFIAVLNVVVTTLICWLVGLIVPLRMPEDKLYVGDYAAHEEEAFALCADVDGATAGNSKPGSPYENYASRSYENYSKDRSYASDSKGGHVPERRYEHPMMSPVSEEQSPYHGDGRRYVNSLYDVDDLFAQSKSIQMV
ncbi:Ammonium transporter 2 member 4 [Linum grandiflorum]